MRTIAKIGAALLLPACLLTAAPAGRIAAEGAAAPLPSIAGQPADPTLDYASEEDLLAEMKTAAENGRYALLYHPATMVTALRDKRSGAVFTSNPYNAARDEYYTGNIKKALESQIVVDYLDVAAGAVSTKTLWSSTDCVELGQFATEEREDGVAFHLSIGEEKTGRMVPEAMSATRFEALAAKLEDRAKRRMDLFYKRYSLRDLADGAERQEFIAKYPLVKQEDIYVLLSISDREAKEVEENFQKAGYTQEDYTALLEEVGVAYQEEVFPNFRLTLEYRLDTDGLAVSIPRTSIVYDEAAYTLLSVKVLPYFGADRPGKGDGYLFIPDGSGALIDFDDSNQNRLPVIAGRVYGRDTATPQTVDERVNQTWHLPVFGVRRNNQTALFATITSGDEMSRITAELGAPNSAYFTVYNTFLCMETQTVTLTPKVASGNSSQTVVMTGKRYDRDFALRFSSLPDGEADYMGMARLYRDYLQASGMRKGDRADTLRLGLEFLGTSLYDKAFLGFRYQGDAQYTTFDQSREIAEVFMRQGAAVDVSLTGWRHNGLDAGPASRVKVASGLGGKAGLRALGEWCEAQGAGLYPDADLLFVQRDGWFDGFSTSRDAARTLSRQYAGLRSYLPDIGQFRDLEPAVSPRYITAFWNKFFKGYGKLGMPAVSLGTVGQYLGSDFDKADPRHRGDALDTIRELLEANASAYALSFDGGNGYVLPYATQLRDVPFSHSGFSGESCSVPFLQLTVAGSIDCFSEPVNLSGNEQEMLLHCIETRTAPSFTLAAQHVERLKISAHTSYYAVNWQTLQKSVEEGYAYVRQALEPVEGQALLRHRREAAGVFSTEYANGARIYVNYTAAAYTADGVTVPAMGYAQKMPD